MFEPHKFKGPLSPDSAAAAATATAREAATPTNSSCGQRSRHSSQLSVELGSRARSLLPSAMAIAGDKSARQTCTQNSDQLSQPVGPPCGIKQLTKLKRFLATLQQFATDISGDTGDRVRLLVMALVNSQITIEEFHCKLQETTNFPLKPYVIPFLKSTLPTLQQELLHFSQLAAKKQSSSPLYYFTRDEWLLFDPPSYSQDEKKNNLKRTSERNVQELDATRSAKRTCGVEASSELSCRRSPPTSPLSSPHQAALSPTPFILSSSRSNSRVLSSKSPVSKEEKGLSQWYQNAKAKTAEQGHRDGEGAPAPAFAPLTNGLDALDSIAMINDDWKQIETMLACIMGMVERTRRSLSEMRARRHDLSDRSSSDSQSTSQDELAFWMQSLAARSRSAAAQGSTSVHSDRDASMAGSLFSREDEAEERLMTVRRHAEDAITKVRNKAALSATPQKVAQGVPRVHDPELWVGEATQLESSVLNAQKHRYQDILIVTDDQIENCQNCGRKANDTCSGCNIVRYCSSFCQHKDWENHHAVCRGVVTSAALKRQPLAAESVDCAGSCQEKDHKPASPMSEHSARHGRSSGACEQIQLTGGN